MLLKRFIITYQCLWDIATVNHVLAMFLIRNSHPLFWCHDRSRNQEKYKKKIFVLIFPKLPLEISLKKNQIIKIEQFEDQLVHLFHASYSKRNKRQRQESQIYKPRHQHNEKQFLAIRGQLIGLFFGLRCVFFFSI